MDNKKYFACNLYRHTRDEQICFTTPEAAEALDLHFKTGYFHDLTAHALSSSLRNIALKAGLI
jgi:hypothetical protein